MVRGIDRLAIFLSAADRNDLLSRLQREVLGSYLRIYAWAHCRASSLLRDLEQPPPHGRCIDLQMIAYPKKRAWPVLSGVKPTPGEPVKSRVSAGQIIRGELQDCRPEAALLGRGAGVWQREHHRPLMKQKPGASVKSQLARQIVDAARRQTTQKELIPFSSRGTQEFLANAEPKRR